MAGVAITVFTACLGDKIIMAEDTGNGGGEFADSDGFVAAHIEHFIVGAGVFQNFDIGIHHVQVIDEVAHLMPIFIDHRVAAHMEA